MSQTAEADPHAGHDAFDCGPEGCSITQTKLTATGVDSGDAFEAIESYFERGWTDGLPIVPPTPARVAAFLDAAGLEPDEVLARIPTRENIEFTAEKVAINAVMSGAKPEYFPVIVAGVRCLGDPRNNIHTHTATASGAPFVTIVNGPIRKELDINCGRGAFGPGWRANATIGRALRLITRNVGRSIHGEFDQAIWSHPSRFTFCFGEDEEGSVWPTIAEDNGFSRQANTVTVVPFMSHRQAVTPWNDDPEHNLKAIAYSARYPGPQLGGPEDTGLPIVYGLTDREFHDVINCDFYPGRANLVVMGTGMQEIFAGMDKWTVREKLYGYMTEEHPILRPVSIAGPELVWIACVGVEGGAWVFSPHPPTNGITKEIERP